MKNILVLSLLCLSTHAIAQTGDQYKQGQSSVSTSDEVPGIFPVVIEGDSAKLMYESLKAKEVSNNAPGPLKASVKNAENIACSKSTFTRSDKSFDSYSCLIVINDDGEAQKNPNL